MAGCGGADDNPPGQVDRGDGSDRVKAIESGRGGREQQGVERARCPAEAANCQSATGEVIFVEAVDPDGDGDAHLVLASPQSISLPGISVIDVRADLRPEPLPGLGDEVSAAGSVFEGSFGQSQIQAEVVNVRRRP